MKIDNLRNKMHFYIEQYGITSEKTLEISKKIDSLVLKELKAQSCKDTIKALIEYSKINDFPNTQEWDNFARKNGYLSHISLKYKLGLKWNEIKMWIISKIL